MRKLTPWLLLTSLILAVDQLTKALVERTLSFAQRIEITSYLDLTLLYNRGAAFSFLAQADGWQHPLFIGIGCGASLVILFLLWRHGHQRLFAFALTLIMSGALGNVIDRVVHGHVIDFIALHYGGWSWPAFNVADSAITLGGVLIVVDELRRVRRERPRPVAASRS